MNISKYVLALLLALFCYSATLAGGTKEGHNIKVKITTLKDTTIYLAYHFGDKQYMKDTIKLNSQGMGAFTGPEKLEHGIYLVVMPAKTYFEIVMGDDQEFSIENDTVDFLNKFKVEGSLENSIFYDDMRFVVSKQKEREAINTKLKDEKSEDKKKALKDDLGKLDKDVLTYRKDIRAKNPALVYSKILYMLEEVEIPDSPKNDKGEQIDSFFTYRYYREHYFDHIDLADPAMLKTPILYNKVDYYLEKVAPQHWDSIIPLVEKIIQASKKNDETYKFWVVTLLNKYANSKMMGMDAVYVYIGENYYASGKATWVDSADVKRIGDRVKALKPTLIGKKAPALVLRDTTGVYQDLYATPSKYVVLFFYDPDCGHCKKETPMLVHAYDSLKTLYDVKVYAVATEIEREKWVKFIKEFKTEQFMNVADIELHNNFREVYDIQSTPRIFLLDQDRIIRAKRFSPDQLGMILDGLVKMDGRDRKLEDNVVKQKP